MSELNRRDFGAALAAFAALGGVLEAHAQEGGQAGGANHTAADRSVGTLASAGPDGKLSGSFSVNFDAVPAKHNANGGESRQVLAGYLPTGEFVEVHETSLPPGQMPHPAHYHRHSEFVLIRQGEVEFYKEGVPERVSAGGIIFNGSGKLHGLKNVGTTMAQYFVVAIGVQTEAVIPKA